MAAYEKLLTQGSDLIYPKTLSRDVFHIVGGGTDIANATPLSTLIDQKAPLASPQFTGAAKVAGGTDYTTGKLRNIYFSTSVPTAADGVNGDIWIVYVV